MAFRVDLYIQESSEFIVHVPCTNKRPSANPARDRQLSAITVSLPDKKLTTTTFLRTRQA